MTGGASVCAAAAKNSNCFLLPALPHLCIGTEWQLAAAFCKQAWLLLRTEYREGCNHECLRSCSRFNILLSFITTHRRWKMFRPGAEGTELPETTMGQGVVGVNFSEKKYCKFVHSDRWSEYISRLHTAWNSSLCRMCVMRMKLEPKWEPEITEANNFSVCVCVSVCALDVNN